MVIVLALMIVPVVFVIGLVYFIMRAQKQTAVQAGNLVRCPDCGSGISRSAQACPHCGRPIVSVD
ncbi:MAG: 50S ribosomal protein L32 [Pirellulaceae bacterium]|nr:50S ribosomal protein L32 [Pirellulaceae bacterium]